MERVSDERSFLGSAQLVGWPHPRRGPWFIYGHWAQIDGHPECVGIELYKGVIPEVHAVDTYKRAPGAVLEGLSSTDLRELPVATLLAALWRSQTAQIERTAQVAHELATGGVDEEQRRAWARVAEESNASPFRHKRRPGRAPLGDEHFAEVAAVYERARADPGRTPRAPTKAVAEHFATSHSTATKWVARARAIGLLDPTRPGKASDARPKRTRRKR